MDEKVLERPFFSKNAVRISKLSPFLNSYMTNFFFVGIKKCAKICEKIAIAGGFYENPHVF